MNPATRAALAFLADGWRRKASILREMNAASHATAFDGTATDARARVLCECADALDRVVTMLAPAATLDPSPPTTEKPR